MQIEEPLQSSSHKLLYYRNIPYDCSDVTEQVTYVTYLFKYSFLCSLSFWECILQSYISTPHHTIGESFNFIDYTGGRVHRAPTLGHFGIASFLFFYSLCSFRVSTRAHHASFTWAAFILINNYDLVCVTTPAPWRRCFMIMALPNDI